MKRDGDLPSHVWLAKVFVAIASATVVLVCLNKVLHVDEWETLYASWLISAGQTPYRDFHQIHTPILYYLLAPLFFWVKLGEIFVAARLSVLALSFLNALLLFRLAGRLLGKEIAWFSLLFYLISYPILIGVSSTLRPDLLVMIFANAALLVLLDPRRSPPRSLFASGFFIGLAFLAKQSGIVPLIALFAFFAWRHLHRRSPLWSSEPFSQARFALANYRFVLLGFGIPLALFLLFLDLSTATNPFFERAVHNDFLRAAVGGAVEGRRVGPLGNLEQYFFVNPLLFLTAIHAFRKGERNPALHFLFVLISIFAASLFFIFHAWSHEFVLMAQYASIVAGAAVVDGLSFLRRRLWMAGGKGGYGAALLLLSLVFLWFPFLRYVNAVAAWNSPFTPELYNRVLSLTNPPDAVLSICRPFPGRPTNYFNFVGAHAMESPTLRKKVEEALIGQLYEGRTKIVVFCDDERERTLPDYFALFQKQFVAIPEPFFIPGKVIYPPPGAPATFDLMIPGLYRPLGGNARSWIIDGRPFTGEAVFLGRGPHTIFSPEQRKSVRLAYDLKASAWERH
jgi:hypothetical protein